jgi:hypothetical protein
MLHGSTLSLENLTASVYEHVRRLTGKKCKKYSSDVLPFWAGSRVWNSRVSPKLSAGLPCRGHLVEEPAWWVKAEPRTPRRRRGRAGPRRELLRRPPRRARGGADEHRVPPRRCGGDPGGVVRQPGAHVADRLRRARGGHGARVPRVQRRRGGEHAAGHAGFLGGDPRATELHLPTTASCPFPPAAAVQVSVESGVQVSSAFLCQFSLAFGPSLCVDRACRLPPCRS